MQPLFSSKQQSTSFWWNVLKKHSSRFPTHFLPSKIFFVFSSPNFAGVNFFPTTNPRSGWTNPYGPTRDHLATHPAVQRWSNLMTRRNLEKNHHQRWLFLCWKLRLKVKRVYESLIEKNISSNFLLILYINMIYIYIIYIYINTSIYIL